MCDTDINLICYREYKPANYDDVLCHIIFCQTYYAVFDAKAYYIIY